MTRYRVDHNDSPTTTPVGMNSLAYLGGDYRQARTVFVTARAGIDHWGNPNPTYGVTLAEWRGQNLTGEYVVIDKKGFPT